MDLVLPSKLGGILASGRSVLVTADLGTELYDLLFGIAILVPPGDVQALAEAIKSASRQRSNPPAEATKLLEQFSSRTILPAFHQAFVETKRLDSVYEQPNNCAMPLCLTRAF